MSYLEGIIEYLPKCLESKEATDRLLFYFDLAFHSIFDDLDKSNPLHYWAIDDFIAGEAGEIRDNKIHIEGTVFWIRGGMGLGAFRAEIVKSRSSIDYRFEFLPSHEPRGGEVGRRLVIVGSRERTTLAFYDRTVGLE